MNHGTPPSKALGVFAGMLAAATCFESIAQDDTAEHDAGWVHPMTPWGDPDLRGIWPIDHMIGTPLVRPEEMGDRLFVTDEEFAEREETMLATQARYDQEDSEDRIGMGHWAEPWQAQRQTSLIIDPPDGQLPELTEFGAAKSETLGSSWFRETWDTPEDFDVWDRCITRGMPPSMLTFRYNNGIAIMQAPGYVVIRLEMIHDTRVIPVDGRPPLDPAIRHWMGESRGHWEGNTLVVETTNFNGIAGMTNVATVGTPWHSIATSESLRIVERFTLLDDDTIRFEMTIEDPEIMTAPWTITYPWQRDQGYEFYEYACHEDNYTIRDYITTSRYERAQAAAQSESEE